MNTSADPHNTSESRWHTYSDIDIEHMKGMRFSSYYSFKFLPAYKLVRSVSYRLDILKNLCRGKKVIHFGCCDHIGVIDSKIKSGIWAHKVLCDEAEKCVGIDIDQQAIEYVKNLGYTSIEYCDVMKHPFTDNIRNTMWDLLVCGEILEHVGNPVEFLEALHIRTKGVVKTMVFSVPNAFSFENFWNTFRGREGINTDHYFYYTPYTLARCMCAAGLEPVRFCFCDLQVNGNQGVSSIISRFARFLSKAFCNTILIEVKVADVSSD